MMDCLLLRLIVQSKQWRFVMRDGRIDMIGVEGGENEHMTRVSGESQQ